MPTARKTPDHGAALRVPPAHDTQGWRVLLGWLGDAGQLVGQGEVEVATAIGAHVAAPGDWIVLSATGAYHVARPRQH
jgi:hypothetical protein